MPSYSCAQVERALRKLLAKELSGGRDRKFIIVDDTGEPIARTKLSRSWRPKTTIGANMIASIKRELRLQNHTQAFDLLLECPLTRDAYLQLVKDLPPPPSRH